MTIIISIIPEVMMVQFKLASVQTQFLVKSLVGLTLLCLCSISTLVIIMTTVMESF